MKKQHYQKNKRLRVFAGPNGSGKSRILDQIQSKYNFGYYVNADEIEKKLKSIQSIDLLDFGINDFSRSKFNSLLDNHPIIKKAREEGYKVDLVFEKNCIVNPDKFTHSYEAAFIADFLRNELLNLGKKFAFETVMSHSSKIDFLKASKESNYKNYLYFISTEDPIINVERVKQRVSLGGHPVAENKIISRYHRSLKNLKDAVKQTYRSFIFDNSGQKPILILDVFEGNQVTYHHDEIPQWVDKYLPQNPLQS